MRFQLLKPRMDVASPEQVSALRQRRGWTVEELADAAHASALEVSAWEAGTVRVPAEQAQRIHWHTDLATWAEALDAAQERTCPWVQENAPHLYEFMFSSPDAPWFAERAPLRAHLAGCAHCQAVWKQAQGIGGFPEEPDTSGSLRSRYWRWLDRLPRRVRAQFAWTGVLAIYFPVMATIGLYALTASLEGFWAHVSGLVCGVLFAEVALLVVLDHVIGRPLAAFLSGFLAGASGLLGWALVDAWIDLGDPRYWAAAMTVGFARGLLEFGWAVQERRKVKALAAGSEPLPPRPAEVIRLMDEWRAHHVRPLGGGNADPGFSNAGWRRDGVAARSAEDGRESAGGARASTPSAT